MIDINCQKEGYEELSLSRTAEHTRAFIKVQDGCNQFCTYCIIPYARGRVRSRKPADVLDEIQRLAENGYQEVVLTGIHLSSYGIDIEDDLLHLIEQVHEIKGTKDPFRFFRTKDRNRGVCKAVVGIRKNLSAFPSVATKRMRCNVRADEPQIYNRRIRKKLWISA